MLWADQWNNLIVSEEHQWSKRRWSIALFSRGIDPSLLSHLPFFSSLTSLINLDSSPRFGSMIAVLPRRYNIAVNRAADRITFESANCWTNCSVRTWLSSIWISRCIILNVTLITSIVFLWAIIISWTWLFVLCIHRNQVPRQGQSIDKNKQNKTIMRLLSWLTRGAVFRLWSKRLSCFTKIPLKEPWRQELYFTRKVASSWFTGSSCCRVVSSSGFEFWLWVKSKDEACKSSWLLDNFFLHWIMNGITFCLLLSCFLQD